MAVTAWECQKCDENFTTRYGKSDVKCPACGSENVNVRGGGV